MKSTGKKICITAASSQLGDEHMVNTLEDLVTFGFLLNGTMVQAKTLLGSADVRTGNSCNQQHAIEKCASKSRRYNFLAGFDRGFSSWNWQRINQNKLSSEA